MTDFLPPRTMEGVVEGVFVAPDALVSEPAETLTLTYAGVVGDRHCGLTRVSGPREPWYQRGTEMRNERQVSILSAEELAEVAAALSIDAVPAEWIGGNLVLSGIAQLSLLPPRTLLMFPSGAAIRVDGDNGPCRAAGRSIARRVPGRPDLEFAFVRSAQHRRGLVGWVEREGEVRRSDRVQVRLWERSLYP